jgi:hypothetical protein
LLTVAFAGVSLPVYIGIELYLDQEAETDKVLSRASRQLRLSARLAAGTAVLSAVNIFVLVVREPDTHLAKLTCNLHIYAAILIPSSSDSRCP